MANLEESIARLGGLAERLNQETESVNQLIDRANLALASMNLGITLWLSGGGPQALILDESGDSSSQTGYQLGYAKVEERWQIAVRHVRQTQRFFENDESQPWTELIADKPPLALEKASRSVRLEACAHLSQVVETLAGTVERQLESLEKAKAAFPTVKARKK